MELKTIPANGTKNPYAQAPQRAEVKLNLLSIEGWQQLGLIPDAEAGDGVTPQQAFQTQSWYRRAAEWRASALSDVPFTVTRGDTIVYDSDSPDEVPPDLLYLRDLPELLYLSELSLPGESAAYWLKAGAVGVQTGRRKIDTLRWLVPTSMKVLVAKNDMADGSVMAGDILGYRRTLATGGKPTDFRVEDVVYLRSLSPYAENVGADGVGRTALAHAKVLLAMDAWLGGELSNGVIGKWVLVTESKINTPAWERFLHLWRTKVKGTGNAGEPIAMTAKSGKLERLSASLSELQDNDITESQKRGIAAAFGVPYTLLTSEAANFATAANDLFVFYAFTVRPEGRIIERQVNRELFDAEGLRFRFEWDRLEVFQAAEVEKATSFAQYVISLIALADRGTITDAELRNIVEDVLDVPELETDVDKAVRAVLDGLGKQVLPAN